MVIGMAFIRRIEIPIGLFGVFSLFLVFDYFTGIATGISSEIIGWGMLLWVFSYLVGYVTLLRYHLTRISKRQEAWYSILLILCFVVSAVTGRMHKPTFDYIFANILTPLQISMLSYVGFYTYTVLFRGARTRNIYAAILLAVAVIVMLWQAPAGRATMPILDGIAGWIRDVPNTGAMRAILIGIGLGIIVLFLRTLMGYEKSYVGGE